jgi:hypothetical protein
MKPILVLGPEPVGAPPRERHVDVEHRAALTEATAANGTAYSSVIVVNDGGADTVRRLLMALGMRRRRKHLCVGVLTYLDDESVCLEGVAHAVADPGSDAVRPLSLLMDFAPGLRIELRGEVLKLEYQTV